MIDQTFIVIFIAGLILSGIGFAVGYYMRRVESNVWWKRHNDITARQEARRFKRASNASLKGWATRREDKRAWHEGHRVTGTECNE